MIVPNCHVSVHRADVLVHADLRVQLNIYAGDAMSGGTRGELEGNLLTRSMADIDFGDIVTIIRWGRKGGPLPPFTVFTAGTPAELGLPGRNRVVPLYGGRRQG